MTNLDHRISDIKRKAHLAKEYEMANDFLTSINNQKAQSIAVKIYDENQLTYQVTLEKKPKEEHDLPTVAINGIVSALEDRLSVIKTELMGD